MPATYQPEDLPVTADQPPVADPQHGTPSAAVERMTHDVDDDDMFVQGGE